MLLLLLERSGEIVSKAELEEKLWGKGAFGEHSNGLYVVAAKLREAIGDDPIRPIFIETVPGRGYTFIGDVIALTTPVVEQPPEVVLPSALQQTIVSTLPAPSEKRRSIGRWRIAAWTSAAVVILAGSCLLAYSNFFKPLIGEGERVVFGGLTNATGNHDLDQTIDSGVELDLQESPYFNLASDREFHMEGKQLSLQEEMSACAALDAKVLIKGQISGIDRAFLIQLTAWGCSSGRLLTTQTAEASSESAILDAVDLATKRMRRRLGEPEHSIRKYNVPLEQGTTASLAAFGAFARGEQQTLHGDTNEAINSLVLAVDLDPQFALAYARLGSLYTNMGQQQAGRRAFQRAFDLRAHSTDREKLYIIGHYYDYVDGDTNRAIAGYKMWLTLYPWDPVPANNLALDYLMVGSAQQALDQSRRAVQLDPGNAIHYLVLGDAYLKLGDYHHVDLICKDPVHGKTENMGLHRLCFRKAFVSNDASGMQQQLNWAHGKEGESSILDDAAWAAMAQGMLSEAQRLFESAKTVALQGHSPESASDVKLDEANLEADIGLTLAARKDALEAMDISDQSASQLAWSARALARVGESTRSENLAKQASSMAPLNTILNFALLASVRAANSLNKKDGAAAISELEITRPYDRCSDMEMSLGYYRGLAYLQNQEPQKAIGEFKNVIDHASIADFPIYISLAKLELGHALQMQGDDVAANEIFAGLNRTWKNADPDFPPLQKLRTYQRPSTPAILQRSKSRSGPRLIPADAKLPAF